MQPQIVHCIATLEGGGAERQLCYLVKALTERGWGAHIVILKGGVNLQRLRSSGATIHQIDVRNNHDLSIVFKIRKILSVVDPVAVQCWQRPMEVYGALAAMLARQPFITVERTSPSRYGRSLKGVLKIMAAQFSSAVVSNSQEGKAYWQRKLIRTIPNVVVPNIVPFEELAQTPVNSERGNYIVAVGRLSREKNYAALLTAMKLVVNVGHAVKLYILGDGPDYASLAKYIAENRLIEVVTLSGYRDDVWVWMNNARAFVSLSLYEGQPNAVLEAAALGVPMLLSDIPAHRTYFDEESAELVDPQDASAIATALVNILSDPSRSQQKATRARAMIESATAEKVTDDYIALYNQLKPRAGLASTT